MLRQVWVLLGFFFRQGSNSTTLAGENTEHASGISNALKWNAYDSHHELNENTLNTSWTDLKLASTPKCGQKSANPNESVSEPMVRKCLKWI